VDVVTGALIALGIWFLLLNVRLLAEWLRFRRRRAAAILIWPPPRPPFYGLTIALGFATGALVLVKIFVARRQAFAELMMFIYFAYLVPMTRRIGRGFYEDGIWADSNFIPYNEVGGISWREGEESVALVLISRLRNLARRLTVPAVHYGAARRVLRDKIGEHEIHFLGTGLDLGAHDERDEA
jgi:hypothetical protein